MGTSPPVEDFDLAIFGGTGDLALRKLLPALLHRFADGQIGAASRIIGVARDAMSDVEYRERVRPALAAAADGYAARTGRRYSIEYAMIRDVNDHAWRADLLGDLLAPRLAHVNLIPLNPTPGSAWDASPKPVEREFVRRLQARGVPVTVRDTRGREIDGACGQLAASG